MILGETTEIREEVSADAAFTISQAKIDIYNAAGTKVVDNATATIDDTDDTAQILSYAFTPAATGNYLAVFRVTIGSQVRFFEQGMRVESPATVTVEDYLRNLLDDEDPSAYYWQDNELAMYLARHVRTVFVADVASETVHEVPSDTRFAYQSPGAVNGDPVDSALFPAPDRKTFRAAPHLRFWSASPAPVVYVGGAKITGATGWAYSLDYVNGAITFTTVDSSAGAAINPAYSVQAGFDFYPLHEIAHEALTTALAQWSATAEVQTPTMRVRRASMMDALRRVDAMRQKGYAPSLRRALPR